jgi:23S rRNA pseudouridine2605 synthase
MGRDIAVDEDGQIRLQKLLAQSGVASRRKCEELMLDGEVEVDGEVVTRLGTKVDPRTAVIKVSGKRLPPVSDQMYLVLNKPRGVVSTMADPQGRKTLTDVLADVLPADPGLRLFHVGRLPSFEVEKTYVAEVAGRIAKGTVADLIAGVTLDDGPVQVRRARVLGTAADRSIVELVIHEGRNRIVRRLLDQVGHPVRQLSRTKFGPIELGTLASGTTRELSDDELGELLDLVGL